MNRRGLALLVSLWFIVLVSGVAAVGVGGARAGAWAVRNRLSLSRAGWAAAACEEILLGRASGIAAGELFAVARALDSVDLGADIWCHLELADPGERVHLNRADSTSLQRLLGDTSLVQIVLTGRPWAAVEQLPGSFTRWSGHLTIRGTGRINLLRAPVEVLRTVPGMDFDGAKQVVDLRGSGVRVTGLEDLLARLGPSSRRQIMSRYDAFVASTSVGSEVLVATSTGHAGPLDLTSRSVLTLIPTPGRLAVVRREAE